APAEPQVQPAEDAAADAAGPGGESMGQARQGQGVGRVVDQAVFFDVGGEGGHYFSLRPQHFLYFRPLPQGPGSLRPTFFTLRGCFFRESSPPAFSPDSLATRSRLISSSLRTRTRYMRRRVSLWMAAIISLNIS